MWPARPARPSRRARFRALLTRRRWLILLVPAALVITCVWVLAGYTDVLDVRVLALEVVATGVAVGATLLTRTAHARTALALLSTYIGLTLIGDGYWLVSIDPTGVNYTLGEFEPGFTVAAEIVRYLALIVLLRHALPRSSGQAGKEVPFPPDAPSTAFSARSGRPGRPGLGGRWPSGRSAIVLLQGATSTAALVLLCTPAGGLVAEGKAYSVFGFFDVIVTALAVAVVLRTATSPARPDRRQLHQLLATATGVAGLVLGDAVMVFSQTRAWTLGYVIGMSLAVGGATVLVITYLHPAPRPAAVVSALPPVPARSHPRLSIAVAIVMQHLLPLVIAVVTTAEVMTAVRGEHATGISRGFDGASGGLDAVASSAGVGAATVGTAAAAVVLSLLHAGTRVVRAYRDEHHASEVGRDELTGAYTRRGFTAFAQQHLRSRDAVGLDPGAGAGPARRDGLVPPRSAGGSSDVANRGAGAGAAGLTGVNAGDGAAASGEAGSSGGSSGSPDAGVSDGPDANAGATWSVALLDLDGFKAVNDTFGHDVGDQVLRTVTMRAGAVIDGDGILARFGGDEFVALLHTGPPSAPATQHLLQRLADVIKEPAVLQDGGVVINVGISIGTAAVPYPGGSDELSAALKQADERMYTQKHRHRA